MCVGGTEGHMEGCLHYESVVINNMIHCGFLMMCIYM